jgi:hypothetical protein
MLISVKRRRGRGRQIVENRKVLWKVDETRIEMHKYHSSYKTRKMETRGHKLLKMVTTLGTLF